MFGLANNQNESDLRPVEHALNALETSNRRFCGLHPEILIFVFQLPIIQKFFFDNGKTDARLLISFSATDLSEERRTTILGFHIFTSKVYASLFF